ncbi:MAG: hypothetical protein HPY83_08080 [Anaerolineae bacterium]|nr:hypothetical protein [Anaerolineae bacterium]
MGRRLRLVLILGTGAVLVLLVAGAAYAGVLDLVFPESHVLIERLMGETSERRLASYLGAVNRQDRPAALAAWPLRDGAALELQERRESVTDELLAMAPGLRYQIHGVEWWRNCCEPGPISSPEHAGVARLHVTVVGGDDSRLHFYTFDVGTAGPYWGAAGGNPIRRWRLLDVYRDSDQPLAFPWPRPQSREGTGP